MRQIQVPGFQSLFACVLVHFLGQSGGDSEQAFRQRDVSTWRARKLAGADGKRWGGGEKKGGGASVPSDGLRPAAAFYLLAQGYLECLACLALRVADFSAVHTDLSSGSPGAEGCSGNSRRSFSSETQSGGSGSGSETRSETREWLPAFSALGANRRLIGASSSSSSRRSRSRSRSCLYLGFKDGAAIHRVGRRPPLPLLSFTLNFCHQENTQRFFFVFFVFWKTLSSHSNKLSPSKCSCVTRPRDTMKASFCRRRRAVSAFACVCIRVCERVRVYVRVLVIPRGSPPSCAWVAEEVEEEIWAGWRRRRRRWAG